MEHELTSHSDVVEFVISSRFVRWEIAALHKVRKFRSATDDHRPDLFPTLVRLMLHCLRRKRRETFSSNEFRICCNQLHSAAVKKEEERMRAAQLVSVGCIFRRRARNMRKRIRFWIIRLFIRWQIWNIVRRVMCDGYLLYVSYASDRPHTVGRHTPETLIVCIHVQFMTSK